MLRRFGQVCAAAIVCAASFGSALPTPTTEPATRPARRRVVVNAPAPPKTVNPIPGVTEQYEARQRIRSIYSADYADTSYTGRRALAKRLIDAAEQTKHDLDAKYTLLLEARDLASQSGDVPTAFEAIDRLAETFPIEKLRDRIEALKLAAPELESQAANLAIASMALDLTDQCMIEGDYESADALLALAARSANRGKSRTMCGWIESRAAALRPFKAAYDVAHPMELQLARTPEDPDANLIAGKFVAFVKRDFDNGLVMLSKGSDRFLATLADQDLDVPADRPSLQLKLAEAWWAAAQDGGGEFRDAMRQRAQFWYAKALPNLDGLDRAAAGRRLAELSPPLPKSKARSARPPDVIRLNGHSYRVHCAEVGWETAERLCEEAGGHLVCIETRHENELMVKLARGRKLWLGAVTDGNGRWSWVNSAEFFFNYWSAGEPASLSSDAHVLTNSAGAWKTSTGRAGFICEWDD